MSSAAAASLLADTANHRFLMPFLGRECTVARAARELGVSTNALLYRVGRLEAAGLLRVLREEPRAGRPVKVYRSTADAYYVPFALTSAETLEALLLALDEDLRSLFYRSAAEALAGSGAEVGFVVKRVGDAVWTRLAAGPERLFDPLGPGAPPVLPFWSPELWLDPEDAEELLTELVGLIRRYHARGGSRRHVLHLALAPLSDRA